MNKDDYYNETTAEYITRRRVYHLGKLIAAAQAVCDHHAAPYTGNAPYFNDVIKALGKAIDEANK